VIQSAWRQAWSWGTRLGSHLANQETALTNARRASTHLLRRRVERDEVELYFDDLESRPEGAAEPAVPEQRAAEQGTRPRR
jgi:hypothetical protein